MDTGSAGSTKTAGESRRRRREEAERRRRLREQIVRERARHLEMMLEKRPR
jgi:hypothetical protein